MHSNQTPSVLDLRRNMRSVRSHVHAAACVNGRCAAKETTPNDRRVEYGVEPPTRRGRGCDHVSQRDPHGVVTVESTLTRSLMRAIALCMCVLAGGYAAHTLGPSSAYFTDTEGARASTMGSDSLRIDVFGGGSYGLTCDDHEEIPVSVSFGGVRAGAYAVRSESVPGSDLSFCEALHVSVAHQGEEWYRGALLGLVMDDRTETGEWDLSVWNNDVSEVPDGATCKIMLVFDAYSPALGYMSGGFTDLDAVPLTFIKERCEDEVCEPECCGDVTVVVDQTDVNETHNTVVSDANSGGNTIIGGGTIVTGESESEVVIEGGTQHTVIDIDTSCGCSDCEPCAETQANSADPLTDPSTDAETSRPGATEAETLIEAVQTELSERVNALRRR